MNDYNTDLHSMKMKEELAKCVFLGPEYSEIINEITQFDQTNNDFFEYEKELELGETN